MAAAVAAGDEPHCARCCVGEQDAHHTRSGNNSRGGGGAGPRSLLVAAALWGWLVRVCVGGWGYSGEGRAPMYGDLEAQRHWMETTLNLPPSVGAGSAAAGRGRERRRRARWWFVD